MRKSILGVKPGPPKKANQPEDEKLDAWFYLNRAVKRAARRTANSGMHNPFKRRHKTGPNRHLQAWKAESRVISALKQISTSALAASVADENTKASASLALLAPTFENVWDLSRATRMDLLAIRGMGPKRLAHLATFLLARNVPLAWAETSDPAGTVGTDEEGKGGN